MRLKQDQSQQQHVHKAVNCHAAFALSIRCAPTECELICEADGNRALFHHRQLLLAAVSHALMGAWHLQLPITMLKQFAALGGGTTAEATADDQAALGSSGSVAPQRKHGADNSWLQAQPVGGGAVRWLYGGLSAVRQETTSNGLPEAGNLPNHQLRRAGGVPAGVKRPMASRLVRHGAAGVASSVQQFLVNKRFRVAPGSLLSHAVLEDYEALPHPHELACGVAGDGPVLSLAAVAAATFTQVRPAALCRADLTSGVALNQLDTKFIPVVCGSVLAIVDQHAAGQITSATQLLAAFWAPRRRPQLRPCPRADERVQLERLRDELLRAPFIGSHSLRVPQPLDLTALEQELLQAHHIRVTAWGWSWVVVEDANGGVAAALTRVPLLWGTVLSATDLKARLQPCPDRCCECGFPLTAHSCVGLSHCVQLYLHQLGDTLGAAGLPCAVGRVLASKACRTAIMFGDSLSCEQASSRCPPCLQHTLHAVKSKQRTCCRSSCSPRRWSADWGARSCASAVHMAGPPSCPCWTLHSSGERCGCATSTSS